MKLSVPSIRADASWPRNRSESGLAVRPTDPSDFKELQPLVLKAWDHSTTPTLEETHRPGVVESIIFVLKPLVGLPVHVLRPSRKQIVVPALITEALADLERPTPVSSCRPRRLRGSANAPSPRPSNRAGIMSQCARRGVFGLPRNRTSYLRTPSLKLPSASPANQRFATRSISTSASRASPVTPTHVRAGRRSGGKYEA